jgi:hypothetical protein
LDTYIVRIYRRDHAEPNNIVGVVEIIEANVKETFKNAVELTRILSNPEGRLPSKRKKRVRSTKEE